MSNPELETHRVELKLTTKILRDVHKYQEANGIRYRTTAIVELLRKGLQQENL